MNDLRADLDTLAIALAALLARLDLLERKIFAEMRELIAERNHLLAQLARVDDDD